MGDNFTHLDCEDSATVWPGKKKCLSISLFVLDHYKDVSLPILPSDGIPPDGTPKIVITSILEPIFYVYTIFASAGIVFAIVCMLFNFIFRKRK